MGVGSWIGWFAYEKTLSRILIISKNWPALTGIVPPGSARPKMSKCKKYRNQKVIINNTHILFCLCVYVCAYLVDQERKPHSGSSKIRELDMSHGQSITTKLPSM